MTFLFCFSYDTESLNKTCGPFSDTELSFENAFQNTFNKKIVTGVQQLYVIGLYDDLPTAEVLSLLQRHLPSNLIHKLKKYVTSDPKSIRCTIHWKMFRSKLETLNLDPCAQQLRHLLLTRPLEEKYVKTFHIQSNHKSNRSAEPTQKNTTKMILTFLTAIYQRNVLAHLIKYILLRPILRSLEHSELLPEKRGIFFSMHKRLKEIIHECVLTAFNGSNYDNYLLCNSLIVLQTKFKEKIKIFKKGTSISTIHCINKHNINALSGKQKRNTWLVKLYIKDIRNLVAANVSLDKLGQLFNLNVPKLCFPYNQATSVHRLKTMTSLQPNNDLFWKDNFFGKTPALENRLEAQAIYTRKKCRNVYEFGTYYLVQDCLLLHSILLTLIRTYLEDAIDIFIRRNYSQSGLAYQQFFIIEPSKQILKLLAPKTMDHTWFNYMIKQAVTGGLCTSFVHGKVDKTTVINDHFNYMENPHLSPHHWPNFYNINPWSKQFNQTPAGISTIDIRSLYPSASLKKLPVNTPLFYTRFTPQDYQHLYSDHSFYNTLNLNSYCNNTQEPGRDASSDLFQLINTPPPFYHEFFALSHYLQSLPKGVKILRFQSHFTAMGQLEFGSFPVDGFLSYQDPADNIIHLKIIQYQSLYHHGHRADCSTKNTSLDAINVEKTNEVRQEILRLCHHFQSHCSTLLNPITLDYVEIFDCDFPNHKVPPLHHFMTHYNTKYTYSNFLSSIYEKKLTGLVVVKNLKIKKASQNPIFGFIIQKIEFGLTHLSPYTQSQLRHLTSAPRVVGVHECKSFMVISTEYLNWLRTHFGFVQEPDIYHALFFQLDDYLKAGLENKLTIRKKLKELIKREKNPTLKQNYEIKAELIKLMINSCYGYTLCNLTSPKFKTFENRRSMPKNMSRVKSVFQFEKNVFLVEKTKKVLESFPTLLGHVGCYILFQSKIILLKRLYFLLKYLNPRYAQLCYMDTDSAHFLLKHPRFEDNVDSNLKETFIRLYPKHFETGPKLSGIWVLENFFTTGEYLGEKCYRLYNTHDEQFITHMKGLNANFQSEYHKNNVDLKKTPFLAFNIFFKSPDFAIFKTHMSKNLFQNYVPNKRYFICATGSVPLHF